MSLVTELLKAVGISKRLGTSTSAIDILVDVSLTLHKNQSIAIVGPSGSGKTTLLNLIAGYDEITQGQLSLFGHSLLGTTETQKAQIRGSRLGFVFQDFQLLPALTALENITYLLTMHQIDDPQSRAQSWLEKVGLIERQHHRPDQLSGGECQRVAIARAFALGAELILADEPTGNLDMIAKDNVINLFFELQQQEQVSMVVVTHDVALAKRCDQMLRLSKGTLCPIEREL